MTRTVKLERVAIVLAALSCFSLPAQDKPLRNTVEIDFDTVRFEPNVQNIGAGVTYRSMIRPWVGVQGQASSLPEGQYIYDAYAGGRMSQYGAAALLGRRWRSVALYFEAGFADFQSVVNGGYNGQSTLYPRRNYPDLLLGGVFEVSLSRRWSLIYEVRDNRIAIGNFIQADFPYGSVFVQGQTIHSPQGKIGVGFHF